jgi:serine/threonine protein kinase
MSSTCKASVLAFYRNKILTTVCQHCSTIAQPYSFVKELGQGAYGCVISARHEATGEMCAVKKVRLKLYPMLLTTSLLIASAFPIKITNIFSKKILAKRCLREIKLLRHFRGHKNVSRPVLQTHRPEKQANTRDRLCRSLVYMIWISFPILQALGPSMRSTFMRSSWRQTYTLL